ncbi:MAG: 3'-5' exonuclease [Aureispira sp.]
MNFNLDKDLVFFDIESTGPDVVKDRIMQIALIKYPKDGGPAIEKDYLINPQYPIKEEALKVHGITIDKVRNQPTFKEYAQELLDFLEDADLAGYNSNRFDIPMLTEEFGRVGMRFSMEGRRLLDALQIFYKMEPRTLKAAYKFYCGEHLTGAHDALADTRATAAVLWGQIQKYDGVDYIDGDDNVTPTPVQNNMQALHDFINDDRQVDFTKRFVRNSEGIIVFNFGSNKGEEAYKNPRTLQWIISKDFPSQVKDIAREILNGNLK